MKTSPHDSGMTLVPWTYDAVAEPFGRRDPPAPRGTARERAGEGRLRIALSPSRHPPVTATDPSGTARPRVSLTGVDGSIDRTAVDTEDTVQQAPPRRSLRDQDRSGDAQAERGDDGNAHGAGRAQRTLTVDAAV